MAQPADLPPSASCTPQAPDAAPRAALRLPAIDLMRGVVMILMTLDHASEAFNSGRLFTDSVFMHKAGTALPAAQFLTRWITHLCAPTFVFLAGAALAFSVEKQLAAGKPARTIDRFIVTRGLFIALLDPVWMSLAFTPGRALLQVLYAIGMGLACMAGLRRLSQSWLLGLGLGLMLFGEALAGLSMWLGGGRSVVGALLMTGGMFGKLMIAYPLLPWLSMMVLGFALGRHLARGGRADRVLTVAALAGLAVFLAVRGANSYGNMLLLRDDLSILQWLHTSKYPPSLSFSALELALMSAGLLALFRLQPRARVESPRWANLLLVLGQTALFFYVLHIHLLELAAHLLGAKRQHGLGATYLAAALAVVALWPLCAAYGRYKRAHPDGWTRYL